MISILDDFYEVSHLLSKGRHTIYGQIEVLLKHQIPSKMHQKISQFLALNFANTILKEVTNFWSVVYVRVVLSVLIRNNQAGALQTFGLMNK